MEFRFYQPFFDVDQEEIKRRLKCAIIPLKPEFFSVIGTNPDLWGPVWITTTIIFLLFAAGNLSNYLSSNDKDHFNYEYNFVPIALGVVLKYFQLWGLRDWFCYTYDYYSYI